jgi:hypothetical protein
VCVTADDADPWRAEAVRALAQQYPWLVEQRLLLVCTPPYRYDRAEPAVSP